MPVHALEVGPIPAWAEPARLLGPGPWHTDPTGLFWRTTLPTAQAADLQARLGGLVLAGQKLTLQADPKLPRAAVRQARLDEARRRRAHPPGFLRAGTKLDDEARYSLTAENLALRIAHTARARLGEGGRVLDACCGGGGNAIAFARAGLAVLACEIDGPRLQLARHNAAIYGVSEAITFAHANCLDLLAHAQAGLIFVDPPWGKDHATALPALTDLSPLPEILAASRGREVWAKLPASIDPLAAGATRVRAVFGDHAGEKRRIKFSLAIFAP